MNVAYHILRSFLWLFSWLPWGLARFVGRVLGLLGLRLDKRHRQIVLDNLRRSYPDKNEAWIRDTARRCFEHVGMVFLELPKLVRYTPRQMAEITRIHNKQNLDKLTSDGKGVILLTGHLGNWEWMNAMGKAIFTAPVSVVARPIDWKPADDLVNSWRTKDGSEIVPKDGSARALLKRLRSGGGIALLLDQNVDWYDGQWVDFFGRPACSNKGAALLAMKTKAPVVAVWCFRGDDGKFDVYIGDTLPLVNTGNKLQDVWDNTQIYQAELERIIRTRPEQWFWMHQRWKTKPFHYWPRKNN